MSKKKPDDLLHRSTGQARVLINATTHYLGKFGSPESKVRYNELLTEWLAGNDVEQALLTIDELVLKFLRHAGSPFLNMDANVNPTAIRERGFARSEVT